MTYAYKMRVVNDPLQDLLVKKLQYLRNTYSNFAHFYRQKWQDRMNFALESASGVYAQIQMLLARDLTLDLEDAFRQSGWYQKGVAFNPIELLEKTQKRYFTTCQSLSDPNTHKTRYKRVLQAMHLI